MVLVATVLGSGAWGCAVADLLSNAGYDVLIWCREQEVADEITLQHTNSMYFPGVILNKKIRATTDLSLVAKHSDLIFEAIPVAFLRMVLQSFKSLQQGHRWVVLSKGIEQNSFELPTQIIKEVLGAPVVGILSGPTYARDLVEKQFSAAVLASDSEDLLRELSTNVSTFYFKLISSCDVIGVQVVGAIKNVLAIAVGIAKGAGCKDNTIAYLLTSGMEEMGQAIVFFGGKQVTMYGLAGLGDILLTCTGSLSKNQRAGYLLGQGKTLADVQAEIKTLPEGINTARSLAVLMEREKLYFPILAETYNFISGEISLEDFFKKIL